MRRMLPFQAILHQEQEVDRKLKVRPMAYGKKMLNSNERRYGAAKMLAAVKFVEKFRSHVEGNEMEFSCLKTCR